MCPSPTPGATLRLGFWVLGSESGRGGPTGGGEWPPEGTVVQRCVAGVRPIPRPLLGKVPARLLGPPPAPSASCRWPVAARPTSPLSACRGRGMPEGRAASSSLSKSAGRGAGGRPLPGAAWLRAAGTGPLRTAGSEDTAAEGSEDTRVPRRDDCMHTHAWAHTRAHRRGPQPGAHYSVAHPCSWRTAVWTVPGTVGPGGRRRPEVRLRLGLASVVGSSGTLRPLPQVCVSPSQSRWLEAPAQATGQVTKPHSAPGALFDGPCWASGRTQPL